MLPDRRLQWMRILFGCACCLVTTTIIVLRGTVQYIPQSIDTYTGNNENLGSGILNTERIEADCGYGQSLPNAVKLSARVERQSKLFITWPRFTNASKTGIYLLSAIKSIDAESFKKHTVVPKVPNSIIILTGWYKKANLKFHTMWCCYFHAGGRISTRRAQKRKTHFESKSVIFNALQCVCAVHSKSNSVAKVSLVVRNDWCKYSRYSHNVDVETIPSQKKDGIVLCAKVLYGEIEASSLIEWFEAQTYLGIHKILCYMHKDLNIAAVEVLKYYESIGLVAFFPFDIPENDTHPRYLWEKNKIAWTDAGIAVLDCQERMNEYKYAIVLDTDEILIPAKMELKDSLKRYVERKFNTNRNLAMVRFQTVMHITTWGPTNPNHCLFVGKHVNSTLAMFDRPKYVFRPDRVIPGSCFSHSCRIKPSYKYENNTDLSATIHHFRSCREDWKKDLNNSEWKLNYLFVDQPKPTSTFLNFKRIKSHIVEILAEKIQESVLKVRSFLNVGR